MSERKGVASAAGGLNLPLDGIDDRQHELQRMPRRGRRSRHTPGRAFDARGHRRFELPGIDQEVRDLVRHLITPSDSAAVTIFPTTAAALRPPYPAFSSSTAKAIRGVDGPTGANPTNHACDF